MMSLRRAKERHHDQHEDPDVRLTFHPHDPVGTLADGFGSLERLNEVRLAPGARAAMPPYRDSEVVTYVREGGLAFDDSKGCCRIVRTDEYRRAATSRAGRQRETNASRSDWVHFFQIWLPPSQLGICPGHEQKRFSTANRRGGLRWLPHRMHAMAPCSSIRES